MLAHYWEVPEQLLHYHSSYLIILFYFLVALIFGLLGVLLGRSSRRSPRLGSVETLSFLNNILESSIEYSIIALDLEGRVLTWNAGAKNNYGYDASEMVGKNIRTLFHRAELASGRAQGFFDEALRRGKAEDIFQRVRKNGEVFIALMTLSRRTDPQNKPLGYLLISKDITEQKRLEEQLKINQALETQNKEIQEANRLKNEFLANMSHELRTPLNAIIGFSELLYEQGLGQINSEQKDSLGDIVKSAKLLLEIISDLLDLAKVESGKMEFRPQRIHLEGLVREVLANVEMLFEKKRIHLSCEVSPELDAVYLDPSRFKQVLYNLISNAHKFTPEFGSVSVRVKPDGRDYFRLEVEDNGIGIRREDQKMLFKSFVQLESGTSKKYSGTGLGLALTKQIVEAQGGKVGVFSAIGKGSLFYVVLQKEYRSSLLEGQAPTRLSRSLLEMAEVRLSFDLNGKHKIVVIDNDPLSLKLIKNWFKDTNYQVRYFSEAEAGLEAVVASKPDILVLDLYLPGITGFEILRRLSQKGISKTLPVIVWTALDLTPSEKEKLDPCVKAVVLKGSSEATQAVLYEIEKILIDQA